MQYNEVKPYGQGAGKKEQVGRMFDNIAHRYDFLNHFLSLGIDNQWRNRAIRLLAESGAVQVLDVATGTGDLALTAARRIPGLEIEAVDISSGMLDIGRLKAKKQGLEARVRFSTGDSEALPFEDNRFDAVMVAFGVRNFENLELGLREMHRVLRPGGVLIVLEFSKPRMFPVRQLFGLYFRFVLPLIGRLTSRDPKAYTYLFESVQAFPDYGDFTAIMEIAGFRSNNYRPLSLGICSIYSGVK